MKDVRLQLQGLSLLSLPEKKQGFSNSQTPSSRLKLKYVTGRSAEAVANKLEHLGLPR